jgi:uncharacterized membrane protein YfcA
MQEIIFILVGIIVGAMNAIAGGGMLVGFPVLLAAGIPALNANATTSLIVLPGQVSSLFGYRKYIAKIPRRYFLLAIPCALGAVIGTTLLRRISPERFNELVPGLILLAVILFAFQPFLHRHAHRHIHGSKKKRESWKPIILLSLAFFPVAIYGGFFGAGFGFIMLAFLGFTKLHEIHRMNALKNIMTFSLSATSLLCLAGSHLIDWRHGAFMAAGNLVGGYAGARGAQKVSSHAIRVVVIVIGLCAAAYLGFRNY